MKKIENNKYKNQNGAISLFVMIAMLFFLITIVGVYVISSKRAQMQTESVNMIQGKYYTEGEESTIYDGKIANAGDIIPIYTKEQLWSIGNSQVIEIEGKLYDFSETDLTKYELKNNIVINIDELEGSNIVDDSKIIKNSYEIYYYKDGEYYEPTNGTADLTVNGNNFKFKNLSKAFGYATDGLMLHYDGIKNTATGHSSNTTKWRDLSGNGNDGTLNGCTWEENNLSFDGIDDWVSIGEMNYSNITLEVVMEYRTVSTSETEIVCNFEGGGYALGTFGDFSLTDTNRTKNAFTVNINGDYYYVGSSENIQGSKKYVLSGSYDGNNINFYENGLKSSKVISGTIKSPNNNTIMTLGTNPSGVASSGALLNGKITSVRMYNRALTDSEVQQNYEIDKLRFGI